MTTKGWIAVDLDGTLAEYHGWQGPDHIGLPIPAMVARIKRWLAQGKDVRIFTARVDGGRTDYALAVGTPEQLEEFQNIERVCRCIEAWCLEHIGQVLPVTNSKDYGLMEIWDDCAVQVEKNTGRRMDGVPDPQEATP